MAWSDISMEFGRLQRVGLESACLFDLQVDCLERLVFIGSSVLLFEEAHE